MQTYVPPLASFPGQWGQGYTTPSSRGQVVKWCIVHVSISLTSILPKNSSRHGRRVWLGCGLCSAHHSFWPLSNQNRNLYLGSVGLTCHEYATIPSSACSAILMIFPSIPLDCNCLWNFQVMKLLFTSPMYVCILTD